jgi:hypothetical protein
VPTNLDDAALALYAKLMTEIKTRLSWLQFAVEGKTGLSSDMIREFGHLQLRMTSELVALGCLVAHGDIRETASAKLRSAYSAAEIMNSLERLHSDFYPKPIRLVPSAPGSHHFERIDSGFMTKAELLRLYGKLGDHLHRGNLKRLLKPNAPIQKSFPELLRPAQQILNLLESHHISLIGGRTQFVCRLRYGSAERVHIFIGEAKP